MLAMRPSATAIERIQLNQAGAAGISEEASRSSPKPSRNRTIAVRPTDFHMTLRKGGENIWVKDSNASESISGDFRKPDIPAPHHRASVGSELRFVIAAELEQMERRRQSTIRSGRTVGFGLTRDLMRPKRLRLWPAAMRRLEPEAGVQQPTCPR